MMPRKPDADMCHCVQATPESTEERHRRVPSVRTALFDREIDVAEQTNHPETPQSLHTAARLAPTLSKPLEQGRRQIAFREGRDNKDDVFPFEFRAQAYFDRGGDGGA